MYNNYITYITGKSVWTTLHPNRIELSFQMQKIFLKQCNKSLMTRFKYAWDKVSGKYVAYSHLQDPRKYVLRFQADYR